MMLWKMIGAAVALQLMAAPAMAQSAPAKDDNNAHHYQGGPKTEVPHMKKHPKSSGTNATRRSGGHHYRGGPKIESHHMGEKP